MSIQIKVIGNPTSDQVDQMSLITDYIVLFLDSGISSGKRVTLILRDESGSDSDTVVTDDDLVSAASVLASASSDVLIPTSIFPSDWTN